MNKEFNYTQYLSSNPLLKEEEQNDAELDAIDKEISSALSSGLQALKGQTDIIKEEVKNSQINEAVGSIVLSLLLSTPKLLEIIGNIVNKVSAVFSKEKDKVETGDAFIHAGHYLEKKYLGFLKQVLKLTGIAKKAGLNDDAELDKAAKVMLYTILGAAAVSAGFASAEAIGSFIAGKGVSAAVYGAAKGGLAGLKGTEILDGIKKLIDKK
jgi:hypothetical protein